jgi:hypothetical protein
MSCEHRERTPKAAEMTLEDSLDHFLTCFTREEQLHYWQYFREDQHTARRCRQNEHEYLIREHQNYITVLRNQLDKYREQSLTED